MQTVSLTLEQVEALALAALRNSRTSEADAVSVAHSIMAAEADGIRSHGLARLPSYCDHAMCGKVDGYAVPTMERMSRGSIAVDARTGFAHPAISLGLAPLAAAAHENGVAALAVRNSYNCGVVGHHVERLAAEGLVGLGFVNGPPSIAAWGGKKALFGTNPIALAVRRKSGPPIIIDQSSSVVARGEILLYEREGKAMPSGWALDGDGNPTTDAKLALHGGSLLPAGGYKGAGIALLVEIMAAGLTGASFSFAASSFASNEGGPPRTGQLFVGFSPKLFAGDHFDERLESLVAQVLSDGNTRLPGQGRLEARDRSAAEGVKVPKALHDELLGRL